MEDFFGSIYCWFESFFGQSLADYLWGYNCDTQAYDNPNIFNQIGWYCLLSAFIICCLYYYLFNPVRSQRTWWFITWGITGIVNLFIGFGFTCSDLANGLIGDCLLYPNGDTTLHPLIETSHCWWFGGINFIVSLGFFILFSYLIKWGSSNCKYYPF